LREVFPRETGSNFEYQVGGSLDSNAPSYVIRAADRIFYQALATGEFCYVLNSRQMGKSSLRVRAMGRLRAGGTVCVFIDLTGMGKQDVTAEKWYAGIVQCLVSGCQIGEKIDWRDWWRSRRDLFSPVQRLSVFIEEILLVEVRQNIVIFVDEIDRVLSQNFSLDDFFALIRYCVERRDLHQDYRRLTWSLLGVATPQNLMSDKTQTPFNIGRAISLEGFSLEEARPLVGNWGGKIAAPGKALARVLDWTGGQPFLTQKLCQYVHRELELSSPPQDENDLIDRVVRTRLVQNWEANDEPQHFRTIQDRILRDERKTGRLLGIYGQILERGEIDSDNSPEQMELRLSGLVVERSGKLKVFNRIYAVIFDERWVQKRLNSLRPYATSLTAWLASNSEDESKLLTGKDLRSSLTWALGKSLADIDYQYLVASQELAKNQAETALESLEQASAVLASARQKARRSAMKQAVAKGWLLKIALGVTALVFCLRLVGALQQWEWNLLDRFFLWRLPERADTRVVIVKVDEADITEVGQWPFPDGILARALKNILAQNPSAIGIDIYRDLPVQPGHEELVRLFQSSPDLFGIEKVVSPPIAAPPALKASSQVGFSDQALDRDNTVRRALLAVSPPDESISYSLAVRLALHYLAAKNIYMEELSGDRVRLGKALFTRFQNSDGGYVRANAGGYQTLLNFRGREDAFSTVSFSEVMSDRVPQDYFRSRLVLIGNTAESINDFVETPYGRMAGITVHANVVSQIVAAALDGRALIQVWNKPGEWIWIFFWTSIGVLLSWRCQSLKSLGWGLAIATFLLISVCYSGFLRGWWWPLIPSALGLLGAAGALSIVKNRQRERSIFFSTLHILLEFCRDQPTAGRIALEYLKQSENKENRAYIDNKLAAIKK
jgi:adenylate cyclase